MKKLGLIATALTLALLCAACATPQNEQSGEADAAELAAQTSDADSQETAETDLQEGAEIEMDGLTLTNEWDKVFPQSDKVNHRKVTFHNRYGITLAADLYGVRRVRRGQGTALRVIRADYGGARLPNHCL